MQGVGLPVPDESLVNHYDDMGERSEKLHLGLYASVIGDRYYVDPGFEVDTVNDTHEVHFFLGGRRVATSKRTGLGIGPTSVSEVTTYHPDQVGSNTVTTTSTATSQSVSRTFLDPFGAKQSGTGTDPRYLFTDQERDAETGLDYFHARFYDPWIGRFLEQDPELGGATAGVTFDRIAGDSANLNSYAYALNRPTSLVDPTGAFTLEAGLAAGAEGGIPIALGASEGEQRGMSEDFPEPPSTPERPNGREPGGKGMPSHLPPPQGQFPQLDEIRVPYGDVGTLVFPPDGVEGPPNIEWAPNTETGFEWLAGPVRSVSLGKGLLARATERLGFYPTKIGGGGKLQYYSRITGRYVPYAASVQARVGPYINNPPVHGLAGFAQGWMQARGVEAPPAVTRAQAWGQAVGRFFGELF